MSDWMNQPYKRTARKAHRCIWCGQEIQAGSIYYYQDGVYEGSWQHNPWHVECLDLVPYDDVCDGFMPYENERPMVKEART